MREPDPGRVRRGRQRAVAGGRAAARRARPRERARRCSPCTAEGDLPAPLAALGLGGIWNAEVVPTSRTTFLSWIGLVAPAGARGGGRRPGCGGAAVTPPAPGALWADRFRGGGPDLGVSPAAMDQLAPRPRWWPAPRRHPGPRPVPPGVRRCSPRSGWPGARRPAVPRRGGGTTTGRRRGCAAPRDPALRRRVGPVRGPAPGRLPGLVGRDPAAPVDLGRRETCWCSPRAPTVPRVEPRAHGARPAGSLPAPRLRRRRHLVVDGTTVPGEDPRVAEVRARARAAHP